MWWVDRRMVAQMKLAAKSSWWLTWLVRGGSIRWSTTCKNRNFAGLFWWGHGRAWRALWMVMTCGKIIWTSRLLHDRSIITRKGSPTAKVAGTSFRQFPHRVLLMLMRVEGQSKCGLEWMSCTLDNWALWVTEKKGMGLTRLSSGGRNFIGKATMMMMKLPLLHDFLFAELWPSPLSPRFFLLNVFIGKV